MKTKMSSQFFIILLLVVFFLALLVVWPYISYIILALVLGYTLSPLYRLFLRFIKKPWLASSISVILIILIFFIPFVWIFSSFIQQAYNAVSSLNLNSFEHVSVFMYNTFGFKINFGDVINNYISQISDISLSKGISAISSAADFFVGIVIMFFVMFYVFRDGIKIFHSVADALPLKKAHKRVLFEEIQLVTNAVIYGQLVTSLVQGFLGGLGFVIFGVPNAIFWGFIMAILSFMPVVGTPLVFVPAALIKIYAGDYGFGIGLLAYGFILVMNIDNVLKPLIISEKSRLNPAIILIGVLGGLKIFGFVGFLIGPLVLALLNALIKVFKQDFKPSEELTNARKKKDKNELIIHLHARPPDEHRNV